MKERPILFSGPMVCAILEGRKTQTRRVIKWEPYEVGYNLDFAGLEPGHYATGVPTSGWVLRSRGLGGCWNDRTRRQHCPYGVPGDRLWVREAWRIESRGDALLLDFAADPGAPSMTDVSMLPEARRYASPLLAWRPSIHLPRWASRLTLEVAEVRVQRLEQISEEDARAEGVDLLRPPEDGKGWPQTNRGCFERLWESINGKRAPWASNPWVWAVSFRRLP